MKSSFFQIASLSMVMGAVYALSGCAGYQVGNTKPSVYSSINKIHVPIFTNATLEPRLSSLATNAVLKKMHVDGTYKVSSRSSCDAVLVGRIRDVRKRQLRAVRFDTLRSRELNVTIYIDWHLEDPNTGERLGLKKVSSIDDASAEKYQQKEKGQVYRARHGSVTGSTIQFVDGNFQVTERNALSLAAQDAANKLVSQLSDGW